MKRIIFCCLIVIGLSSGILSCKATVATKPETVVVTRPAQPAGHYVWVEGEWHYSGGKYVQRPGAWVVPHNNKTWVPGHWEQTRRGWYWKQGHWR